MFDAKIHNFIRIAELGSFTEAAESLFVSPAALSQQIKKLERELGFELFDRSSRKAKLTAAGRQFLPMAHQLVQIYENAVVQCRITSELERKNKTRLRAACLNDDVFTIWPKLIELMQEDGNVEDCPRNARYASRLDLYRALLRNEEDFSILLENDELRSFNLCFCPLVNIKEACQLHFPTAELQCKKAVTIDDLLQYRVAFHFSMGHTTYEDLLRKHLRAVCPGIYMGEPEDYYNTHRENQSAFLLVPGIQYSGDRKYVRPLDWGEGLRLGFVTTQEPKPEVMEFIQKMQAAVQRHPELWQF